MILLLKYWREVALLVALLCSGILGYRLAGKPAQAITKSTDVRTDDVVTHTQVVTVTKQPDGTVTTTTTNQAKTEHENSRDSSTTSAPMTKMQASYRLDIVLNPLNASEHTQYEVGLSRRLGDSPFWVELRGRPWARTATLGLGVEW